LQRVVDIMTSADASKDKRIIIPRRFEDLVRSPRFEELIQALLEHLQESVIDLEEERRKSKIRGPVQVDLVVETGPMKRFAENYARLLLQNMHWGQNMQDDQNFFESFYFLVHRLALAVAKENLRPATYERTYLQLDQEIGRIFRSETFNHAKRQQVLAMKAKRDSNETPKTVSELLDKVAQARQETAKFRATLRNEPKVSVKRNGDARSPLMSMILPSPKEMIRRLEEQRKKRRSLARERPKRKFQDARLPRSATRKWFRGGKASVVPEETFDSF
jgi:hypothetical protein